MMGAALRARVSAEAEQRQSVQAYKLAGIRTALTVEDVALVERHKDLFHVRATVSRTKTSLLNATAATTDRLSVDLVERIVPRSISRPDGLEVVEYQNTVISCGGPLCPKNEQGGPTP